MSEWRVDFPGRPFHGLDQEKATLINETLHGYLIRYATDKDRRAKIGVFERVMREGDHGDLLSYVGDVVMTITPGHRHVMSPAMITRFEVLEMDQRQRCHDCGRWEPRERMRDTADPPWTEGYGLICMRCAGYLASELAACA